MHRLHKNEYGQLWKNTQFRYCAAAQCTMACNGEIKKKLHRTFRTCAISKFCNYFTINLWDIRSPPTLTLYVVLLLPLTTVNKLVGTNLYRTFRTLFWALVTIYYSIKYHSVFYKYQFGLHNKKTWFLWEGYWPLSNDIQVTKVPVWFPILLRALVRVVVCI